MNRKHQTLDDVIADMENCAEQYHNGLRLEPQTIGHVFDAFTYELSFYTPGALQECVHKARLRTQDALRALNEHLATPNGRKNTSANAERLAYLKGVMHGMHQMLTDLEMKQPVQLEEHDTDLEANDR